MASIKKRPDGKWRARYRDEAGKEHARHFQRKVDAQRWLDEVTASVVTGRYVDPSAGLETFKQWFARWSDRQVWAKGTIDSAETALANAPFNDVQLKDLRTHHIETWVKSMSTRLSPATVSNRFNFARMALKAAVRDRLIPEDPSDGVRLPRKRKAEATMVLPTPEQVGKAVSEAPEWFRAYVAVCAFAGLRLGEASGLQVGDVDFLRRTLRISRQVQGSNRASSEVVLPKHGSERTVFIPERLVTILSMHVQEVGVYGDEQWLFSTAGHLWHRGIAGHHWRMLREKVGMEENTLHDLRHFYASGLIADGCDVVTVQRSLGHSTPSITLNTYAHLWPTAEDKTRAAASGLMESSGITLADPVRTEAGLALSD